MSKDFEQAYKELAREEAPDLWGRIEAGIDSQSAPEDEAHRRGRKSGKGTAGTDIGQNRVRYAAEGGKEEISHKTHRFIRRYSAVAAAIFCVAAILPAAVLLWRGKGSGYGAPAPAEAEEILEDTGSMEGSVQEAAAEDLDSGPIDETGYAGGGVEESGQVNSNLRGQPDSGESGADTGAFAEKKAEPVEDKNADMASVQGDQERTESSLQADAGMQQGAGSAQAGQPGTDEDVMEADTLGLSDGAVLSGITVEVVDAASVHSEQEENGLSGTLYTVVVREDKSGSLKKGSKIQIFVPSHSSQILIKDEVFRITATYNSGQEYPFTLSGNAVLVE